MKKHNVRLTVTTPNTTLFGAPILLTDKEFEEFEELIQKALIGEVDHLQFKLETDNETVYMSKKLILKSSFVIRKS